MDRAAFLTKLNLRLRDTNDFSFTSDEKYEAIEKAIRDGRVMSTAWDDSLVYSAGIYQYTMPTTIDVAQDIYIKPGNSPAAEPTPVASSLWEVVDGNIHFKNGANSSIPDGGTLYIKGKKKYSINDTITEEKIQEYVLNLAQLHCLSMLGVVKALSFLKNDTSMGEIVAIKRELEREVAQFRQSLPTAFESA